MAKEKGRLASRKQSLEEGVGSKKGGKPQRPCLSGEENKSNTWRKREKRPSASNISLPGRRALMTDPAGRVQKGLQAKGWEVGRG